MGRSKGNLVQGVGINDADYTVCPTVNGIRVWCPFYKTWRCMLQRAYCEKWSAKYLTYRDCSVYKDWHYFTNFKSWMEKQDWEGKELDKDLLVKGNKTYSPNTCVFLTRRVNHFFTDRSATNGLYPAGVYFEKKRGKYKAQCVDFEGNRLCLGEFDDPNEAHATYWQFKCKIAKQLSETQNDERIRNAILSHFKIQE
jgi:hypothetical protein